MACACFCLTLVGPSLRSPSTAHLASPIAPYEVSSDKVLLLLPLGQLVEPDVDFLARSLTARLGVSVEILRPAEQPTQPFDFDSGQYDAEDLLDWLFMSKPEGSWRLMAITTDDLSSSDADHLLGLANLKEGVAIVSLHDFLPSLRSDDPEINARARDQLGRVAFHELTHTLGVDHCGTEGCLMSAIEDREHIHTGTQPCSRCVRNIQTRLRPPRDLYMEHLAEGDGLFQRAFYGHALALYERARREAPWDASSQTRAALENRIGAALLGLEHYVEAERHIRAALELDPALAAASYNHALLLAFAGDTNRAILALERAVALEKDPVSRNEYTARFYLDAFEAPGPAMMALERYRKAGGDDPVLLGELESMERSGLIAFDFDEAEVIVGR